MRGELPGGFRPSQSGHLVQADVRRARTFAADRIEQVQDLLYVVPDLFENAKAKFRGFDINDVLMDVISPGLAWDPSPSPTAGAEEGK
jgi:hypothetical protein